MRLKFSITKQDIAEGIKNREHDRVDLFCPVSNAIKRSSPGIEEVSTWIDSTTITYKSGRKYKAKLSNALRIKIEDFDTGNEMKCGRHVLTFEKLM